MNNIDLVLPISGLDQVGSVDITIIIEDRYVLTVSGEVSTNVSSASPTISGEYALPVIIGVAVGAVVIIVVTVYLFRIRQP